MVWVRLAKERRLCVVLPALMICSCGQSRGKARDAAPSEATRSDALTVESPPDAAWIESDTLPDGSGGDTEDGGAERSCVGRVSAEIGPAGGRLDHCGGSLVVPAGVLAAPLVFGIEPVEISAKPALPSEIGGQALRFTPDDILLPGLVSVAVPHDACDRIDLNAFVDGELEFLEACELSATQIGQNLPVLGTFVAIKDCYPYAESSWSLGTGWFRYTFKGKTTTLTLPDQAHAYDDDFGPGVGLLLGARYPATTVQMALHISEAGQGELTWMTWDLTWQMKGSADVQIDLVDGQHVVGSMTVPLADHSGTTATLTASFDITAPYFVLPPGASCNVH